MTIDDRLAEKFWRPYINDISTACASMVPPEDYALITATGLRETWLGTCFGYSPKGPNGRGDGGHGRGLFQIDDRGQYAKFIPPGIEDWPVFDQAKTACLVYATSREELAAHKGVMTTTAWDEAVACRYNASLDPIVWCIKQGRDPNDVTTKGTSGKHDYGRDVISLRDGLTYLYPDTFPPMLQRNA